MINDSTAGEVKGSPTSGGLGDGGGGLLPALLLLLGDVVLRLGVAQSGHDLTRNSET